MRRSRRETRVLGKLRSLRRSLLALLAVLMVLTAVQLGPRASSAYADEIVICGVKWATREFVTGGPINVIERCEPVLTVSDVTFWDWVFLRFKPANQDKRTIWQGGASTPPYKMVLNAMVGSGTGGGVGAAKVILYNPDGSHLNRTIAARALMQYQPTGSSGWYTCHDSGWKQASTSTYAKRAYIFQYDQPDCGPAYYRTLAAGRFWSISLNKWITRGWIYSPSVWIPWGTAPAEPTSYPTTQTPDTPD
jgi:hypothetical protein